jgi:hypothetical protein
MRVLLRASGQAQVLGRASAKEQDHTLAERRNGEYITITTEDGSDGLHHCFILVSEHGVTLHLGILRYQHYILSPWVFGGIPLATSLDLDLY